MADLTAYASSFNPFPDPMKSRLRRVAILALCVIVVAAGCDRESASTFTPEDSDADYQRGKSLEKQGKQGEALAEFLRVISRRGDDESPESHLEAALIYEQHIKDPIAAIYHFRKFLELDPSSRQADLVKQRIDACKREFARTLPANPENNASVKLDYLDQLDQLQRENDRLKAEITALRAALPRGVNVPSASGEFNIAVTPPTNEEGSAAQPAPSAPIVSAPLGGASSNQDVSFTQNAPPAAPQAARPQQGQATTMRHHTVRPGDTLYSLAQRYYGNRTRWKDIYQANRNLLKSERDVLRVGMDLKIP
ncbi:LysM domain/BON superfamily protein [mine drainage metagenome]|uniref:LysM domain/BON superfamily protein n=1 Tax=mine drainage metagenome TaxID=410659 RepID=A0A1J5T0M6_9ZZZZ